MQLDNINFDESDRSLFYVDDPQLRANALRYSILPRLDVVINECISRIDKIYDINMLEDAAIVRSPHFRLNRRKNEVQQFFDYASVGFNGKRKTGKWLGLTRKDGKLVTILRCSYGFDLTKEGGRIHFLISDRKYYTDESQRLFFRFLIEHEPMIRMLCDITGIQQDIIWQVIGDNPRISTHERYYNYLTEYCDYFTVSFSSEIFPYPISREALFGPTCYESNYLPDIATRLAWFYPIFDSYLQIAKGEGVRFKALFAKLKKEMSRIIKEDPAVSPDTPETFPMTEEERNNIQEIAEKRVKVMPALRWQVFQRDDWKCVSCGRKAADGIILHVDHMIPRSKGGKDELENYQTLCHLCNIGKSNKDSTDLRAKKKS